MSADLLPASRSLPIHEEHGEVVGTWRALGYEGETVVCFDRHIDLKPLAPHAAEQVRGARGVEALRALNRPLPFREAPGAYGLDDFFAAGPVLGAVHALWWVMPGVWPTGRERVRTALGAIARIRADADTLDHTRVVEGVLCTRLCGLDVQVHTLETLHAHGVPARARIDVDLDWLADGDAPPQHTPRELVDRLEALGCRERLDSLTWSVRSGFLGSSMRHCATAVAELVGRPLDPVPWDGAWPMPERTLAALRGEAGSVRRTEVEAELAPLGTIGIALGGCLAVREGALAEAEAAWWQAAEAGLRSSWLAHGIGVACYSDAPARALEWLERASGAGMDTLEVHASTLALMCLVRLERVDEARARAGVLVERHPLHRKLARIAALVAADAGERERFLEHMRSLDALVATGGDR
ncbi:hypothetical protein [Paraliomyxa miuraensis]|uniref:hypothetical protein n=1 Tax=Paraliomyxa miuraensis TaxID=376150 RepID=UPI00224F19CC|nr:hypothetical protein [Paraliomyxa miuraensis]MCX4246365.1 hypothetical protein [Paraliomyxa miuraensis]